MLQWKINWRNSQVNSLKPTLYHKMYMRYEVGILRAYKISAKKSVLISLQMR
jgi:hypothetical protein